MLDLYSDVYKRQGPYGGNPMKVQVLSPAPLNERAPSDGGFFVMGPSRGLEPAKERA